MRKRRITLMSIALLLPLGAALAGPATSSSAVTSTMTNGCSVSARGIPTCGAYVGAAYGANDDLTAWEKSMGKSIGVHRTFWSSGSTASAAKSAKADAAKHRVPWMSFSAPYSWSQMVAGKGDAWAKNLATQLASAGGPVWVAVDHEPENDGGDIQQWKAMQAHLAPIMRAAAPNLSYSIILMGYHEFYGAKKYAMSAIWPNAKIDLVGFDIYEKYGVQKSGQPLTTTWKNFDGGYFPKIQAWSKSTGVPWGLAETAYSDPAAKKDSAWMSKTYNSLVSHGGVAFSYFDTNLHSQANWRLTLATKQNAFTALNKSAPTMR